MAHKQLFGLTDQLGLVNYHLGEVAKLEEEAPKFGDNAPFPVVMSATVIGLCLAKSRSDLEGAASILTGEIDFYEASDRRIEEIEASDGKAPAKADAVAVETKTASAREPLTAGRAAYCLQIIAATQVLLVKAMEKSRSYRA